MDYEDTKSNIQKQFQFYSTKSNLTERSKFGAKVNKKVVEKKVLNDWKFKQNRQTSKGRMQSYEL